MIHSLTLFVWWKAILISLIQNERKNIWNNPINQHKHTHTHIQTRNIDWIDSEMKVTGIFDMYVAFACCCFFRYTEHLPFLLTIPCLRFDCVQEFFYPMLYQKNVRQNRNKQWLSFLFRLFLVTNNMNNVHYIFSECQRVHFRACMRYWSCHTGENGSLDNRCWG